MTRPKAVFTTRRPILITFTFLFVSSPSWFSQTTHFTIISFSPQDLNHNLLESCNQQIQTNF
jgi:hypothetical protein